MVFLHSASDRSGFYRNSESAKVEAAAIKQNAASGPSRPRESAQVVRARIDSALQNKKVQPHA